MSAVNLEFLEEQWPDLMQGKENVSRGLIPR